MAIAALSSTNSEPHLLLHGIANADALSIIGSESAEFAGLEVQAFAEGRVAALVSRVRRPQNWRAWMHLKPALPRVAPAWSALSSVLPFIPATPGTLFEDEQSLQDMLCAREPELAAFVADHASFLECDVAADFDAATAETDISATGPLQSLAPQTEAERALVRRTISQSVEGRRASFVSRMRRCLVDVAADVLDVASNGPPAGLGRRVLIARSNRLAFRERLVELAEDVGAGARLRIGPYLPPASFRRLEISPADLGPITQARKALGVDESAVRASIRIAYHRTLERCYPIMTVEQRELRLAELQAQFGLLDLVAEGQIRAARENSEMPIRFDPDALKQTWLLKFHAHNTADRAA